MDHGRWEPGFEISPDTVFCEAAPQGSGAEGAAGGTLSRAQSVRGPVAGSLEPLGLGVR